MTVEPLLADSQAKLRAALELVFASADAYAPFTPGRIYSPQEREPYDALSDRFLRAFESSLKFFRTWERVREANVSDTFRDLLLRMEKVGLISDHSTWVALRDLRNPGVTITCPMNSPPCMRRSSARPCRNSGVLRPPQPPGSGRREPQPWGNSR
jgi:hypothetical protein